jgi:hypothetical protein
MSVKLRLLNRVKRSSFCCEKKEIIMKKHFLVGRKIVEVRSMTAEELRKRGGYDNGL